MNVNHRAQIIRHFPHRPELFVAQRGAIDVAEDHGAAESELPACALELFRRGLRIAERQRRDGSESAVRSAHDRRESVIDESREFDRQRGFLDMRSGGREAENLRVDPVFFEHTLAIHDVAVSAHGDVVIARIVQHRISLGIDRDLLLLHRFEQRRLCLR
jgi:hypothetical protein